MIDTPKGNLFGAKKIKVFGMWARLSLSAMQLLRVQAMAFASNQMYSANAGLSYSRKISWMDMRCAVLVFNTMMISWVQSAFKCTGFDMPSPVDKHVKAVVTREELKYLNRIKQGLGVSWREIMLAGAETLQNKKVKDDQLKGIHQS